MKKQKLINTRLSKNLSQRFIADKLFMDVSNYSRRESGIKKISNKEWEKIAQILEVPIQDIYESDRVESLDGVIPVRSDESVLLMRKQLLEVQQKYINRLESEIKMLKSQA